MGIEPTSSLQFTQQVGDPGRDTENQHASNHIQLGKFRHEEIQKFGLHCQSFYHSSLLMSNFSTFLDQDKNVGYAMLGDSVQDIEEKVSRGRIVVEALDRIGAMHAILQNIHVLSSAEIRDTAEKSLAKLRQAHDMAAECHRDLFKECGLLDIDKLVQPERSPLFGSQGVTGDYHRYIQMRDAIRRRSHKFAMLQRRSTLFQLLSECEKAQSYDESMSYERALSFTKTNHIKLVISTLEDFVRKYRSNIGSHSLLAGLHRVILLQLHPSDKAQSSSDPSYVVQWNFLGSVLTEACHSNGNGDTQAYARDATKVLFSFLSWIKTNDVERGDVSILNGDYFDDSLHPSLDDEEFLLSFQINKYLSNANLRRILSVLPNPKVLDARATGSVEVLDVKSTSNKGIVQATRINADGHLDETWPWFLSLQFCSVL